MNNVVPTITQQLAKAAVAYHQECTGQSCRFATVALTDDTLVITLLGALSIAELEIARNPAGAAQIKEYHQQLLLSSADPLRLEIKRITGVAVQEAAVEVETVTGTVVLVFTTGAMIQAFLLVDSVPAETWSGNTQSTLL